MRVYHPQLPGLLRRQHLSGGQREHGLRHGRYRLRKLPHRHQVSERHLRVRPAHLHGLLRRRDPNLQDR